MWTSAPGRPLWTVLCSFLGGDATRIGVALGLFVDDGKVGRVVVMSAGPLSGRAVVAGQALPSPAATGAGTSPPFS